MLLASHRRCGSDRSVSKEHEHGSTSRRNSRPFSHDDRPQVHSSSRPSSSLRPSPVSSPSPRRVVPRSTTAPPSRHAYAGRISAPRRARRPEPRLGLRAASGLRASATPCTVASPAQAGSTTSTRSGYAAGYPVHGGLAGPSQVGTAERSDRCRLSPAWRPRRTEPGGRGALSGASPDPTRRRTAVARSGRRFACRSRRFRLTFGVLDSYMASGPTSGPQPRQGRGAESRATGATGRPGSIRSRRLRGRGSALLGRVPHPAARAERRGRDAAGAGRHLAPSAVAPRP